MRDSSPDVDPLSKNIAVPLNRLVLRSVDSVQAEGNSTTSGGAVRVLAEVSAEPLDVGGEEPALTNILNKLIVNAGQVLPQGGSVTLKTGVVDSGAYLDLTFAGPVLDFDSLDLQLQSLPSFTQDGVCIRQECSSHRLPQSDPIASLLEGLNEKTCTVRLVFSSPAPLQGSSAAYSASKTERILLIDDDPILLRVVKQILEADGHQVTVADGGRHGINTFAENLTAGMPFGIVITDFNMPDVDGEEVARAIKKTMADVPVVLLTASGYGAEQGHQSPYFDVVLNKPTTAGDLRSAIAKCRQRKEAA